MNKEAVGYRQGDSGESSQILFPLDCARRREWGCAARSCCTARSTARRGISQHGEHKAAGVRHGDERPNRYAIFVPVLAWNLIQNLSISARAGASVPASGSGSAAL